MRKHQCMHCAEPVVWKLAPPTEPSFSTQRIVDFQQDHCIGCGYCVTGCPFNIPKFNSSPSGCTSAPLHDRVSQGLEPAASSPAPPAACTRTKDDMKFLAENRANNFAIISATKTPAFTIPRGRARRIYVLNDATKPELTRLPSNPTIPLAVKFWNTR